MDGIIYSHFVPDLIPVNSIANLLQSLDSLAVADFPCVVLKSKPPDKCGDDTPPPALPFTEACRKVFVLEFSALLWGNGISVPLWGNGISVLLWGNRILPGI
jgi:hypothetical protein